MDKKIYEKLMELTDEEKRILNGEIEVNKEIYTDDSQFVIDSNKFLSHGDLINIRKHTRFIRFPIHKHNYIEVNYVYEGSLTEIIDGKEIKLKKGELIFLNQNMEHEIEATGENDICINFIIKPEFFDYIFSLLENDNVISKFLISTLYTKCSSDNMGESLYFKCADDKYIQEILEKITTEIYSDNMMSNVTIKLLVGLLLVELVKNQDNIEIFSVDNYEKKILLEVFKYIDEFYKEGSLFEIASKLNQPHYKLSKLIKKHTSMTFKELLQEKKLNKAIELLKIKELSVVAILEEIGYENPTYFYKIFKEKYGVTPKEYR
ncbi:MAG: AraC family transcriptional regulator, partial [Clostridium sp.]|nr:AraC family transcriptional regulator [Clostridium sp.]